MSQESRSILVGAIKLQAGAVQSFQGLTQGGATFRLPPAAAGRPQKIRVQVQSCSLPAGMPGDVEVGFFKSEHSKDSGRERPVG